MIPYNLGKLILAPKTSSSLFSSRPWHRHPRELGAWRTRHNQRRTLRLTPVQRQDVLEHELRRIPMLPINVPLNIEPDHVIPFSQSTFSPTSKPREKVYAERLHFPAVSRIHFARSIARPNSTGVKQTVVLQPFGETTA